MTYEEFEQLNLCQGDFILVTQEFKSDINNKTIVTSESFELLGKGAECLIPNKDATIVLEERIGTGTVKLKLKDIKEIKLLDVED